MNTIPDFSRIPLNLDQIPTFDSEAGGSEGSEERGTEVDNLPLETPEGINIKSLYTSDDLGDSSDRHSYPGFAPYLRGPYPTMYTNQPWTIRQYAGFSTPKIQMLFTDATLPLGKKAFPLPSISPLTVATTQTMSVS